jgi:hypothetical protein
MSSDAPQFTTNLSLGEVEALIRRVVKEAVHEEFARVFRRSPTSIADEWTHEGPVDPEGDRILLAEALQMSEQYRTNPETWIDWDAFKAELKEAESSGELPH